MARKRRELAEEREYKKEDDAARLSRIKNTNSCLWIDPRKECPQ